MHGVAGQMWNFNSLWVSLTETNTSLYALQHHVLTTINISKEKSISYLHYGKIINMLHLVAMHLIWYAYKCPVLKKIYSAKHTKIGNWPISYKAYHKKTCFLFMWTTNEPRCEKTGLRGFRPGPTQTGLHNHTRWLEAWNFVYSK